MNSSNDRGNQEPAPAKQPESETNGENAGKEKIQREIGGRPGPDPTRYGDWEKGGRCIDF